MIAKNEERRLGACLASARPWVDEIVLVDTGSSDRTVDIAQGFGARDYHHAWEGDFAKHRLGLAALGRGPGPAIGVGAGGGSERRLEYRLLPRAGLPSPLRGLSTCLWLPKQRVGRPGTTGLHYSQPG
ncbi:MAG: glycosyltransferase [Desulfarculus sp.]|nr:glycosyltransferase [Desulfarculus sp.]